MSITDTSSLFSDADSMDSLDSHRLSFSTIVLERFFTQHLVSSQI